ncbi:MAG: hypothetical protein LBL67_03825 [Coriobacteriales bacterium]|jgi:hypothetical protein|nr:hypothetical protein [Coriobacteriales bacterium]
MSEAIVKNVKAFEPAQTAPLAAGRTGRALLRLSGIALRRVLWIDLWFFATCVVMALGIFAVFTWNGNSLLRDYALPDHVFAMGLLFLSLGWVVQYCLTAELSRRLFLECLPLGYSRRQLAVATILATLIGCLLVALVALFYMWASQAAANALLAQVKHHDGVITWHPSLLFTSLYVLLFTVIAVLISAVGLLSSLPLIKRSRLSFAFAVMAAFLTVYFLVKVAGIPDQFASAQALVPSLMWPGPWTALLLGVAVLAGLVYLFAACRIDYKF